MLVVDDNSNNRRIIGMVLELDGVDAHVAKPVDPATLLSTIAAFCAADADSEPAARQAG